MENEKKIIGLFESLGLDAPHKEINKEMKKYFVEEVMPTKEDFVESMLFYMSGSDFYEVITMKNVELFRKKLDPLKKWEHIPGWLLEILTFYYSDTCKGIQVWFNSEDDVLAYISEKLKKEKNQEIFSEGFWEEYKMSSMFQREQSFEILREQLEKHLLGLINFLQQSKVFVLLEEEVTELLEENYVLFDGVFDD